MELLLDERMRGAKNGNVQNKKLLTAVAGRQQDYARSNTGTQCRDVCGNFVIFDDFVGFIVFLLFYYFFLLLFFNFYLFLSRSYLK